MVVREGAGACAADAFNGLTRGDAETAEEEAGDEAAAVHSVLAHHVDAVRRLAGQGDGLQGHFDRLSNAVRRSKRTIEVWENARKPTAEGVAIGVVELAGAIDEPGCPKGVVGEGIANVAVGAAHPDFGLTVGGFVGGEDEAGPRHMQRGLVN